MKPKKIWGNFSVQNTDRTYQFYTQIGFTPNGPNKNAKLTSFLFGDSNFVIHFFEQGSQIDAYLSSGVKTNEIIFTLSADTEAEVKELAEKVKDAGGSIFHEVGRNETNHYGFGFADPDGHKFNVLLMESGM